MAALSNVIFRGPDPEKDGISTWTLPGLTSTDATDLVYAALTQGFGWVMLYGGASVWILAAASFLVYGRRRIREVTPNERPERIVRLRLSGSIRRSLQGMKAR